MTAPDNDVRPARRAGAESARGAGALPLARLLLHPTRRFFLLFAVASLSSSCIIPIGPDFQDPEGAPNAPPEILAPDPTWGAVVSALPQAPSWTFHITVTDVNGDPLSVKWIVDGEKRQTTPVTASTDGTPVLERVSQIIGCEEVNRSASSHTVEAAVADRAFVEGDGTTDLLKVEDGGHVTPITWTLNLTCLSP